MADIRKIEMYFRHGFIKNINLMSAVVFLVWYITPYIRVNTVGGIYNFLITLVVISWFLTSIVINPKWLTSLPHHVIIVSIMLISFFIMAVLNIAGNPRAFLMLGTSFWFPVFMFHFYKSTGFDDYIKIIIYFV